MTTRVELRHVRDVMNDDPTTVAADTPLEEIVQLFAQYGYDGFPVVDAEGALVGIVTKLDVLGALRPATMRGQPGVRRPVGVEVGDVMHPGVMTLEADDPVVAAVDLMCETRFHSLPVVRRQRGGPARLVGMVSRGDLLRAFL